MTTGSLQQTPADSVRSRPVGEPVMGRANRAAVALLVLIACLYISRGPVAAEESDLKAPGLFAIVNGQNITWREFNDFFHGYARSKAYHRAPDRRNAELRVAAAEALIRRRLVLQEANRRGIAGNSKAVDRKIQKYEKRYKDSSSWPKVRNKLPRLRKFLLESSKYQALSEMVRNVTKLNDAALRAFYANNLKLFTEPARTRISVIMLGVEPWRDKSFWASAKSKADALAKELAAGASFAELARKHSTHVSAKTGGDLGYLHRGTLSKPAQAAVDRLAPGKFSPPVRVLEGYALFRLVERQPPHLRTFNDVRTRVLALYKRNRSNEKWNAFVDELRRTAVVRINKGINSKIIPKPATIR